MDSSYLIVLLCSCACKALSNFAKETFDRSLDSSNEDIFYSNLLGKVTRIFSTTLYQEGLPPIVLLC
jgi:hypothetical protein